MEHDRAQDLMVSWVEGDLDPTQAEAVAAHADQCVSCREVRETMLAVSGLAERRPALFEPHPAASELVAFAVGDSAGEDRLRLGAHVRACPTCTVEVDVTRHAWAGIAERSPLWGWSGLRIGALVVGAVIAALSYPAYLGLVRLPREHARAALAERRGAEMRSAQEALSARLGQLEARLDWSGGAPLLFLSAGSRGGKGPAPGITLRDGQPFVQFAIATEVPAGVAAMELRILRGETVTFTRTLATADAWDPQNHTVSVLLPSAGLLPGVYELELVASGNAPFFGTRFEILASSH